MEMSLNFAKIRTCPGKNVACEKIHLEQKSSRITIMLVEEKEYRYIVLISHVS